jgi:uncharacterized protein YecE (DUF72 family)
VSAVVRIGTQGWNYPAWVGPFYPAGTRPADMLGLYAKAFSTVEIDATFYATPADPVVAGWRRRVPASFIFSLKVPQEITHERRLVDVEAALTKFIDRVRPLGDGLGPLLLQTPPDWMPTKETRAALADFLPSLPHDLRWAIEFRDHRWLDDKVLDLLQTHGVALTLADGRWIERNRVLVLAAQPTAAFAYVRWMGPDRTLTDYSHVQVDRDGELALWGEALSGLRDRVREIFGYFNNHFQGHSPWSARTMQRRLGLEPVDPASLRVQRELF